MRHDSNAVTPRLTSAKPHIRLARLSPESALRVKKKKKKNAWHGTHSAETLKPPFSFKPPTPRSEYTRSTHPGCERRSSPCASWCVSVYPVKRGGRARAAKALTNKWTAAKRHRLPSFFSPLFFTFRFSLRFPHSSPVPRVRVSCNNPGIALFIAAFKSAPMGWKDSASRHKFGVGRGLSFLRGRRCCPV